MGKQPTGHTSSQDASFVADGTCAYSRDIVLDVNRDRNRKDPPNLLPGHRKILYRAKDGPCRNGEFGSELLLQVRFAIVEHISKDSSRLDKGDLREGLQEFAIVGPLRKNHRVDGDYSYYPRPSSANRLHLFTRDNSGTASRFQEKRKGS